MARRVPAPPILTLVFLVFLVGLLLVGSLLVRAIPTESFADAEQTRAARILAADALRAQLHEETGVRGYAATRDQTRLLEAVESAAENRADDPATAIRDGIFSRHHVSDDVAILTICFVEPVTTAGAPNATALGRTA
jgi:hypothetical protein